MFGYVRVDTPYLYIKDQVLYKAAYCGLCKGIARSCGQCARFGLSYDMTFFSLVLHNIAGVDLVIEKQHCPTRLLVKKPMAKPDELTDKLGAVNTVLCYYKFTDDIADGDRGRGKRLLFKKGRKRALKKYPDVERIVKTNLEAQEKTERTGTGSVDRAADATANMMAELTDYLLGDAATEFTHGLFYAVGKWIYLIDALDDYDKDKKKGAYNPFVLGYGSPTKAALIAEHGEEVRYVFNSLFFDIRDNLSRVKFRFNRDLVDNILLRGLPSQTERVLTAHGV